MVRSAFFAALAVSAAFPVALPGLTPAHAASPASAEQTPSFTGLWKAAAPDAVRKPDLSPENFTPEAVKRARTYEEQFVAKGTEIGSVCYTAGMPWMMLTRARDYVYDIYQSADRIFVTFEPMDQFRTIYLDRTSFPENLPPSRNGYSVGRFENGVLKIETRGLIGTNEQASAMQRTDKAVVHEEWKIVPDKEFGHVIEIALKLDDPALYKQPAAGYARLKQAPEGSVASGYNCPEALWDDLVEKTLDPGER